MTKREAKRLARRITKAGYHVLGYRHHITPNYWTLDVEDTEFGTSFEVCNPEQWRWFTAQEVLHATR